MKVVLDTNVLISGIFFTGPPHRILEAWREGRLQLVLTAAIVDEYRHVSERLSAKYPAISTRTILQVLVARSHLIQPAPLSSPVCQDPDDDRFVAAALAADAVIVSGDRHLLDIDGFGGLRVMRPASFVRSCLDLQ